MSASQLIMNLLLVLFGIAAAAVALAMLLVVGVSIADEVRLRMWHRRSMRHVDETLRGGS